MKLTRAELTSVREKWRSGIELSTWERKAILKHYEFLETRYARERKLVQAALRRVSPELLLEVVEGNRFALEGLARTLPGHLVDVAKETDDGNWKYVDVVDSDVFTVIDEDGLVGGHTGLIYAVLRDILEDKSTRPGILRLEVIANQRKFVEFDDPNDADQYFLFAIEADGRVSVIVPAKSDTLLQVRLTYG